MAYYLALIHRPGDGGFMVEIPDLPGCIAKSRTPANAISHAGRMVSQRVAALRHAGTTLPERSSLQGVMTHQRRRSVAAAVVIPYC